MATLVTKTVKPGGGGDYTTLQAAIDALPANLVTADEQWDIELHAGDAGQGSFATQPTTDATRYVRIFSAMAARHAGVYSTSGKSYLVRSGSDGAIQNPPSFTRIEGLQVRVTGDDNNMYGIGSFGAGVYGVRVVGCLIVADPSSTTFWSANCHGINFGTDVAGDCFAINNILYGWNVKTGGGNVGIKTVNHDAGKTYCYNNTLVDCDIGIADGYGDVVCKNNLVDADTTAFSGTIGAGSNYNATNLGTASGGANDRVSQTFTFVNAAAKDFHLAAGDGGAKDFGTDLSGDANFPFSDDIDGATRAGSWDIGADEVTDPILEQEGFGWYNDDGNEAGMTTAAAQDTDITAPVGVNRILRELLNATNDPASTQFKLQVALDGTSNWRDVTP